MLLPLLLLAVDAMPTLQAAATPKPAATAAPAKPTLLTVVAQRMSPIGRPIFERYIQQTLVPQARADGAAELQYRKALQALVAAPTLDMDAAARLIEQRKLAQAQETAAIRSSALAMIKSLPAADRKLALTAIFAEARLPAKTPAQPAKAPAQPTK